MRLHFRSLFPGAAVVLTCVGASSEATVAPISLALLADKSERIVIARVDGLHTNGGQLVARATPERVVGGPENYGTFFFMANPTWDCDTSCAVRGERVLLFLETSKGRPVVRKRARAVSQPFTPLYRIAADGRGRIPIGPSAEGDEVLLTAGPYALPTEPSLSGKPGHRRDERLVPLSAILPWIERRRKVQDGGQDAGRSRSTLFVEVLAPQQVRPGEPIQVGVRIENRGTEGLYIPQRVLLGEYLSLRITDESGRVQSGPWERPRCPAPPRPADYLRLDPGDALEAPDLESAFRGRCIRIPRAGRYRISVAYESAFVPNERIYPRPLWRGVIGSRAHSISVGPRFHAPARAQARRPFWAPAALSATLLPSRRAEAEPRFRLVLRNRSADPLIIDESWNTFATLSAEAEFPNGESVRKPRVGCPPEMLPLPKVLKPGETSSVLLDWNSLFAFQPPAHCTLKVRFRYCSWPAVKAAAARGEPITPLNVLSEALFLRIGAGGPEGVTPPHGPLVLSSLRPGRRLTVQNAMPWAEDRAPVALLNGKPVSGPGNLVDAVEIRTPKEALEYVRLFSGVETHRFFGSDLLEARRSAESLFGLATVNRVRWERLHLREPVVRRVGSSFEISRCLLRYPKRPHEPIILFRSLEYVQPNGSYDVLEDGELARGTPNTDPYLSIPYY